MQPTPSSHGYLPALVKGETEQRSQTAHTFWGALLGGTILTAGSHAIMQLGTQQKMPKSFIIGIATAGGILGAWQGSEMAKDHNRWADALNAYRSLDAQNRLLPEYLPAVDTHYYSTQNTADETLIAAARGALIWGAASLAVELMAYGPKFSWQKMDKGLVLGDAILWGSIESGRTATAVERSNHRAEVVGYYTAKARAHAAAIPPVVQPPAIQGYAMREETRPELSGFAAR